jgi:hypothetical protein
MDINRNKQWLTAEAREGETDAPTADECTAILRARPLTGKAIRKGIEERSHERDSRVCRSRSPWQIDESEELIGRAENRLSARGVRVEGRVMDPFAGLKRLESGNAIDDIGPRADGVAIARSSPGTRRSKWITLGKQCRGKRGLAEDTSLRSGQK